MSDTSFHPAPAPLAPANVWEGGRGSAPRVAVCITLYNYAAYISEALASVSSQTEPALEIIIVDDLSTDDSPAIAHSWLQAHAGRFCRATLLRHPENRGLSAARNTAAAAATAPYLFILDADNLLYPRCVARCADALDYTDAWFAYPMLEVFGAASSLLGNYPWSPARLAHGNYIDAMAMLRRERLFQVGGYDAMAGWEDFDLWCKIHEAGGRGLQVPEVLARYRQHHRSMLRTSTNRARQLRENHARMQARHPWLTLEDPSAGWLHWLAKRRAEHTRHAG